MNNFRENIVQKELKEDEKVLWAQAKTLKMLDYYIISPLVGYFIAFYATYYAVSDKIILPLLPYLGVDVPDKDNESGETAPDGINWMGVNDNYVALLNNVNFYTTIGLTLLLSFLIAAVWMKYRQFYILTDKRLILFRPKIFFVDVDTLLLNRIDDVVLRNGIGLGRFGMLKMEDKYLHLDYPDAKKLYDKLLEMKMKP